MSSTPITKQILVTVNQTNGSYTWAYEPPVNPKNVIETLEPGNYEITFTVDSNFGATWAAEWIQWTNVNGTPSGVTVQSPTGNQAVLLVDNTVGSQQQYDFKLSVMTSNGEPVTSPDPEIVLDPP